MKLNQKTQLVFMRKVLLGVVFLLSNLIMLAQGQNNEIPGKKSHVVTMEKEANVHWWMGLTAAGQNMPFTKDVSYDTYGRGFGNQCQPLVLSDNGDVIWSDSPIEFKYTDSVVTVLSHKVIKKANKGTLRDAYLYASKNFFPPTGTMPGELLFTSPQYNTWIELGYNQSQQSVLEYAHAIIANNYPPGVLMIDTNWQHDHGVWEFNRIKFPDAHAMMKELHSLGFKVMLWVCPMVSPDSEVYRYLRDNDGLMKTKKGTPALFNWWDGYSAELDLSKKFSREWFHSVLHKLMDEYGVDGFKFDVGDASYYSGNNRIHEADDLDKNGLTPNQHSELFGKMGLKYSYNELRCIWKLGGLPIAQRLTDKRHSWSHLNLLIPQMMTGSIMGYPFMCPDMIGGGLLASVDGAIAKGTFDQELFVRSAQCHALMPMMQFSLAPWRVLDKTHHNAVKKAVQIREQYKEYILALAKNAAKTGEPIMRNMEYNFPHQGYATIKDQFMLGDKILVAPVLEKGVKFRKVVLPKGKWKSPEGKIYKGGKTYKVEVSIYDLPYFHKVN